VFRINFKLALMMFTVHTRRCPDYLTDSVQTCNSDPGRTRLRSASSTILFHGQKRNLATEPSLCPAQSYGTVCRQQFVKQTACIRSSTSSKLMCSFYVLMTDFVLCRPYFTNFCNAFISRLAGSVPCRKSITAIFLLTYTSVPNNNGWGRLTEKS